MSAYLCEDLLILRFHYFGFNEVLEELSSDSAT